MAKKKHHDHTAPDVASEIVTPAIPQDAEPSVEATTIPASHEAPTLMDQVQSFLAQRTELAAKLAAEIKATEEKLAELRKTSALLFPEATAAPSKDKKAKKPAKPKVVSREEDATSMSSETDAA